MNDFRKELDALLYLKQRNGGGFHYVYQANQLKQKAKEARKLQNLLKTSVGKWQKTLEDTRLIIDTLE